MSDQTAKQQIVDKLRDIDTVLVTVNSNPTVDELSAALGFTLLINKLNKHATAVFSGDIPPAITFLDPEKTFENTVNSLRDFIIALDKEKADHLRYKVDGDMVKIFITPYRTTIDDSDLDFSQGDYNVEMVVALGVRNSDDLDRALADHGRIMHDATVASVSIGSDSSELGSINWHENDASSYSELLVSLSEALRNDKKLIDEQIATAFLTGIVAATDRFSNSNTSSKVMTMAAQLMAAGANQQLIAAKLEEAQEISQPPVEQPSRNDGTTELSDKASSKIDKNASKKTKQPVEPPKDKQAPDGTMTISHEKKGTLEEVSEQYEQDHQRQATKQAEDALADSLASSSSAASAGMPSVADLQDDIKRAAWEAQDERPAPKQALASDMALPLPDPQAAQSAPAPLPEPSTTREPDMPQFEPTFGGTLNATSSQAADDKRRAEEADKNKQILSHDGGEYAKSAPNDYPTINAANQPEEPQEPVADYEPLVGSGGVSTRGHDLQPLSMPGQSTPAPSPSLPPMETLADIDRANRAPAQPKDAQSAIEEALQNAQPMSQQQQQIPTMPSPDPTAAQSPMQAPMQPDSQSGLPPLPPMPDFSSLPPMPSAPGVPSDTSPAPAPGGLPTVSPVNAAPAAQTPPPPPTPADPGQFKIPGQ